MPPSKLDSFGLGFRMPCLVISPYVREGFIDHAQNDFCSILKFIETRYDLPPLTNRDASTNNMLEAFDFNQVPRAPLVLPGPYIPKYYPITLANPSMEYTLIIEGLVAMIIIIAAIVTVLFWVPMPNRVMRLTRILVSAIVGGVVIALLTGLISNTPPMLIGAIWYGYPLAWLYRLILAPEYFPWRVNFLNLGMDIISWAVILGAVLLVLSKYRAIRKK